MKNKKKEIYLIVILSPFGLRQVTFKLVDEKPEPFHYTKGEGSCMIFKLVDGDFSTNFNKAIENGTIMNEFGNFSIDTDLSNIPEKKKKFDKEVEKMKKENKWS